MINRNTPNNELLSNIHGAYTDYKLLKQHLYSCIHKYLKKQFPNENKNLFTPDSYVELIEFNYDKGWHKFHITLTSDIKLSKVEIKEFGDEFDLKLSRMSIIHDGYGEYLREDYSKYSQRKYFNYDFERKPQI